MAKRQKVLILGRGFIGSHLARSIRDPNTSVFTFSRSEEVNSSRLDGIHWVGDFAHLDPKHEIFKTEFDVIFHTLSSSTPGSSEQDPIADISQNLIPTISFVQKLRSPDKTKFVFISSAGTIYGHSIAVSNEESPTQPICAYGITKLAIEKHLVNLSRISGMKYLILRATNPYGPWNAAKKPFGLINNFVDRAVQGKELKVLGELDTQRDYLYIDDLISAIKVAAFSETESGLFNVSFGTSSPISQVIDIISAQVGASLKTESLPARHFDLKDVKIDSSAFRKTFNWSPQVSLSEGIKRTIGFRKSL